MLATLQQYPMIAALFLFGVFFGIPILWELFTGELRPYRWDGGYLCTHQKEPGTYWSTVGLEIAAFLGLIVYFLLKQGSAK